MKNQNHIVILVHKAKKGETYFKKIRGREMQKHIEEEIDFGRRRYKRLMKEIKLCNL
jgi:hypothetical protein